MKSTVLAAILGFIFNIFSLFYFHWKMVVGMLFVNIIHFSAYHFLISYSIPEWYYYLNQAIFGVTNIFVAYQLNKTAEDIRYNDEMNREHNPNINVFINIENYEEEAIHYKYGQFLFLYSIVFSMVTILSLGGYVIYNFFQDGLFLTSLAMIPMLMATFVFFLILSTVFNKYVLKIKLKNIFYKMV